MTRVKKDACAVRRPEKMMLEVADHGLVDQ